jgi:DNA-binding NarL/FixJ family response regulator
VQAIRIVLADDHPVVRAGIRTLLEKAPGLVVVGEADDGMAALRLVAELSPDVLLLDMELPGHTGVEVARQLQAAGSPVRVLALSAYDDSQFIFGLLASGAAGYLTKDEVPQRIVDAVRGVARDEGGWLSRRVMEKVLQRQRAGKVPGAAEAASLTTREREVLRLVAKGQGNEQVAATLHMSEGTVKNHVTTIYSKLRLRTRAEAVAWAWQQGLMNDGSDTGE